MCTRMASDIVCGRSRYVFHLTLVAGDSSGGKQAGLSLDSVEVSSERLSVCLINDYGDTDIPLCELTLSGMPRRHGHRMPALLRPL